MGLRRAGTARSAEAPNVFVRSATRKPMATNAAGRARPPEASGRNPVGYSMQHRMTAGAAGQRPDACEPRSVMTVLVT
jgi:hypothetical protein